MRFSSRLEFFWETITPTETFLNNNNVDKTGLNKIRELRFQPQKVRILPWFHFWTWVSQGQDCGASAKKKERNENGTLINEHK